MSRPQVIDDQERERVHDRVAAIDVAKDSGMVCTRTPAPARQQVPGRDHPHRLRFSRDATIHPDENS